MHLKMCLDKLISLWSNTNKQHIHSQLFRGSPVVGWNSRYLPRVWEGSKNTLLDQVLSATARILTHFFLPREPEFLKSCWLLSNPGQIPSICFLQKSLWQFWSPKITDRVDNWQLQLRESVPDYTNAGNLACRDCMVYTACIILRNKTMNKKPDVIQENTAVPLNFQAFW